MEENLINESDYAAQGIFMDWSSQFADIEKTAPVTEKDIQGRIQDGGWSPRDHIFRTKDGKEYNLPEIISSDGTDMYMLTQEGITIYMALDAPMYFQEITEETVRFVRYYADSKKKYTRSMFRRYEKWESYLKKYFESNGVPPELTEICLVESACTYTVGSSAGARGMWQIMPYTARQYGMTVNETRDDRTDPIKSTAVAVRILKDNYKRIGEWTMTAASYNCGPGNLQKYAARGMQWDDVYPLMPKETQRYIPALLALHYVWTYRSRLGLAE